MTLLNFRLALLAGASLAVAGCGAPTYPVRLSDARLQAPAVARPAPAPAIEPRAAGEASPPAPEPAPKVERRALDPLIPQEAAPSAESAAAPVAARAKDSDYKVRRGDTLDKIAKRLGTSVTDLAKENGLKKPYRLMPGQTLSVPGADDRPAKGSKAKAPAPKASGAYTVKSGDTLYSIARRNGLTVEALRDANDLGRGSSLRPGQKLKLPGKGGPEAEERDEPEEAKAPAAKSRAKRTVEIERPDGGGGDRSAGGKVVTITVTGQAYKVRKGDTLEKIAGKLDVDMAKLAKDNRLKKPYRLRPGQVIRGPGKTAKAYVVARGDTLSGVAQRFDVSESALRSANGLRRGASVAPGRKLRLPAGYRDRGPIAAPRPEPRETPPPVRETSPPTPSIPQPYTPPRVTPPPRPSGPVPGAPVATPPPSEGQIVQMGAGRFAWPLRGEIISGFGGAGAGPRNDGLNIRANAGDSVRAAAAGDVVYAGDQVPGFGNLVLIKHADGWVTAYGHMSKVEVRMQQKVTQGQQIGLAGASGGVTEPQLHFEVRYAPSPQERAKPVDPALVLPK